ncbi:MAG TPA: LppX_LprAFG lipoprotein [Ktedonobacterales bacterium]
MKYNGFRFVPATTHMITRLPSRELSGGIGGVMLRLYRHRLIAVGLRAIRPNLFFTIIFAATALFAVAGCGVPGGPGATKPKPTATPSAQQILTNAKNAHLTDETFTLTLQGAASGTQVKVDGTGKATENPARVSMSLSTEVNGTTISLDEIVDGASNTAYTRITAPPQLATKTWTKTSTSSSPISGSDLQANSQLAKLANVKLVGSEQVNGVATWHIQGTVDDSSLGGNATVDAYVRQSDYLPVKITVHSTGDTALDLTIVYTAINTGIKIDLPNV